MFGRVAELTRDRESVLEEQLRVLVDELVLELSDQYADHRAAPAEPLLPGAAELERLLVEGGGLLDRAVAADRLAARAAADRAEALAGFARSRPVSMDRPDTEVGAAAAQSRAARPAALTAVSEWAVDEVAVALSLTSAAASELLADSVLLVERLPATLAALRAGRISWRHARVMTDVVARLPEALRPVAEERLLARVDGKTHSQLRVAARRVVQRLDAAALLARAAQAVRERRVTVYPGEDGMATLSAVLPVPVARAVQDALRQYADAAASDGDERTTAQRMVDCLVDLVLRPGEHGMPPVQARLTLVAAVETLLGSDEPGEVDGNVVPAEMVRQLAIALGLLPADGTAEARSDVDRVVHGEPADPGTVEAVAALLRSRTVAGSSLGHRPHVALVDELSGQLVALTDATGLRHGGALGPPGDSPGYRPGRELDRFVRLRDRRCRFPGCRARATRCDLDHRIPWPRGSTSSDNLCCLCRHHHRLSHQAPGWRLRGLADGGLQWTTPGGIVATTHPPRFGADDDLPRDGDGPPDRPPADVVVDEPPPF
ncbi:HNH endonuclease signature motif containing protein [Modestobacter versicolor]|uniref:HNH nuclease domain-containing protein n=1 Tax=Modestobacter versicolor TaxID=429133 RepID=A0A839XYB6_9ACTN|nr:HNH endonuclease signature motif containing protein [Modestobacter versicolor]MBB3675575.1 hypothetical protein [Modestobacter versicolor]